MGKRREMTQTNGCGLDEVKVTRLRYWMLSRYVCWDIVQSVESLTAFAMRRRYGVV